MLKKICIVVCCLTTISSFGSAVCPSIDAIKAAKPDGTIPFFQLFMYRMPDGTLLMVKDTSQPAANALQQQVTGSYTANAVALLPKPNSPEGCMYAPGASSFSSTAPFVAWAQSSPFN